MAFHRLSVPSYFGDLPVGYDYINNADTPSTQAAADNAKSGGPNTGTYFVAFGEDATSLNANRPVKALAENCDLLDDLFHRDIAVRTKFAAISSGTATASITVTGAGQYVGEAGTPNTAEGIATFAEVLDADGDPVFSTAGSQVRITSITGATPGGGFSAAASITYNLTPSIPASQVHQLVYSRRGNLGTFPVGQLAQLKSRSTLGARTHYAGSSPTTWADGSSLGASSVDTAITRVLVDLGASTGANKIGSAALPNWRGGGNVAAGRLYTQLNTIVAALAADAGASKIGCVASADWLGGLGNPADSVAARINKVIVDLSATTTDSAGAGRIGASSGDPSFTGAPYVRYTDSVHGQLYALFEASNDPYRVRAVTADTTLDASDRDAVVMLEGAGGTFVLPDPAAYPGRKLLFIRSGAGGGAWDLNTPSSYYPINEVAGAYTIPAHTRGSYLVCSGRTMAGTWGWYVTELTENLPAAAKAGSPYSLAAGTVASQLIAVNANLNAHNHAGVYMPANGIGSYYHDIPTTSPSPLPAGGALTIPLSGSAFSVLYVEWLDGLSYMGYVERPGWADAPIQYNSATGQIGWSAWSSVTQRRGLFITVGRGYDYNF